MPPPSSTACCQPRSVATADTTARPRRRRRWPFLLLALALLGGIAALALRNYTQPEKLTAMLVEQAKARFDVDLALEGPADFGFLPRLHLRLRKPQVRSGNEVLLSADAIDVRLPWSSVNGPRIDIEHVEIVRPRLQLDTLSHWLASRPPSDAAVPDVRFSLSLRDGTLVVRGKPVAEGLQLDFRNADDLAAWFERITHNAQPLLPPASGSGSIDRLQIGTLRIDGLKLDVRDDDTADP